MRPLKLGKRTQRLAGGLAIALLALGGGVWVWRSGESGPKRPDVATAGQASDPDPTFPTRDQAQRYFLAKVEGERRSVATLDAALTKARAAGADPAQIAKLEALRADYQARLRRHEVKLTAVQASARMP